MNPETSKDSAATPPTVSTPTPPISEPVTTLATPMPTLPEVIPQKRRISRPLVAGVIGFLIPILGYLIDDALYGDIVAMVNGTPISQQELDENVALMIESAALQGLDAEDPAVQAEIRTQTLNNLISNALLITAARDAGITVDDARIEETYAVIVENAGGAEELTKRMDEIGLTDAKLRSNIADKLLVDSYVESVTDIENMTVTDDEINSYVARLTESGVVLPPLDQIYNELKSEVLKEKQGLIISDLITSLTAAATIEIQ